MRDLGFYLGLLISILLGIYIIWFVYKKNISTDGSLPKFDERQNVARMKSYKMAFFVLAIYVTIYSIVIIPNEALVHTLGFIGLITGIFVSMVVFAILCILNDAYEGLNENKNWVRMFVVIALINAIISLPRICVDGFFEGDVLASYCINFECVIMMVIVLLVKLAKDKMDGNEE